MLLKNLSNLAKQIIRVCLICKIMPGIPSRENQIVLTPQQTKEKIHREVPHGEIKN
jgi:hypothetical protein